MLRVGHRRRDVAAVNASGGGANSALVTRHSPIFYSAMQRPTPWLMLVVLLVGLLFLREPQVQHWDDVFLRWLLKHSRPVSPPVPLTVVELGVDESIDPVPAPDQAPLPASGARNVSISPLEFALFLQSAMEFKPEVIAFESILRWRERDKDQEQVFLDQAMRVPKLLLAAELTATPDPDAPGPEIRGFSQVKGKRSDLVEFSGVGRQPNEDMRLISTLSFVNLPDEISSDLRVPLLFLYRGEVIPSFALQAILLWMRVTPAEVQIEIGSHVALPDGRKIPIAADGTMLIHPAAAKNARHLTLNELLLATQQREAGSQINPDFGDLGNQIVLARTPANPLAPPDVFAATVASIQANKYLRRIPKFFDAAVLLIVVVCVAVIRRFDGADLVLCGIAFTAAYCLAAVGVISQWQIWLPGILPLGAVWLMIVITLVARRRATSGSGNVTIPPPIA